MNFSRQTSASTSPRVFSSSTSSFHLPRHGTKQHKNVLIKIHLLLCCCTSENSIFSWDIKPSVSINIIVETFICFFIKSHKFLSRKKRDSHEAKNSKWEKFHSVFKLFRAVGRATHPTLLASHSQVGTFFAHLLLFITKANKFLTLLAYLRLWVRQETCQNGESRLELFPFAEFVTSSKATLGSTQVTVLLPRDVPTGTSAKI